MSINVPDGHNQYFSRLVGHLDLNNLGYTQKKNIKKYIMESVGATVNYSNAITKHIASVLWKKHVGPTHPHIIINNYEAEVNNYKAGSKVWQHIEEFLTMCLLLSDDHTISYDNVKDKIKKQLVELENIKKLDPNEEVKYFKFLVDAVRLTYDNRRKENKEYKAGCSEGSYALLQKLKKALDRARIPVPEDNPAIKVANDIIEGNMKHMEVDYITNSKPAYNEYYRLGG